ncbi:MAG: aminofutalosine synthase MqnE [Nitrospirae bacterium]|nr:aminofutalosine synthase MqnE [Nitrospirota bacterium]
MKPDFRELGKRLLAGGRLTDSEAVSLFETDDIFSLGELANRVAVRKNKKFVYYIKNMHINPGNICTNRCMFCAFSRNEGEPGAYEYTLDEMVMSAANVRGKVSEFHIVGGLNPKMDLGFYSELFTAIKAAVPGVYIKALTAVEIDYLSKLSGKTPTKVLEVLRAAGLDSMPGGGAEIFKARVRNKLCPEKIPGSKWLRITESAHKSGLKTTATMLFGHVETYRDRVDHLSKLRQLQDKTEGFLAFIPLPFHPSNTRVQGTHPISGLDILRTIAVSRLYLDNFDHIKAYWIMTGEKLAQTCLMFGADDLDGTVLEEKITHAAGAESKEAMSVEEITHIIRTAGRTPVERDTFYNRLKVWK